ncbi:MAG: ABC transporter ATP-binding protein [Lewinellaceae bacterium]|nr:ABC transporter ATP-binding protein [Lewinellaceae bacterium]
MIPANDILGRRNEVKDYVAASDIENAVRRLIDFMRDFIPEMENDALLLSRKFTDLERNERLALLDYKDTEITKGQISNGILKTLDIAYSKLIEQAAKAQPSDPISTAVEKENALIKVLSKQLPPDDLVLEANNIVKGYPVSNFTVRLGQLQLRLGQITGLVGENATGKTTLLRILAGDLALDEGMLHFPLFDPQNRLSWPNLKQKIAYLPQELPVWYGSLRDNLRYTAALHSLHGEENRKMVNYIVQRLGLALHLDKTWVQLSGGYKLRFALAKALVWKTQLLILDEPLAFLDVKTQIVVLNDLRNLAKSLRHPMAVLMSSQQLHEIEAVADQILFMQDGKLENLGNTADLGRERTQNVFELGLESGPGELAQHLEQFPHYKIWNNGLIWFVATPLSVSGFELQQHLAKRGVKLDYYRDLSRSVKIKFYGDNL